MRCSMPPHPPPPTPCFPQNRRVCCKPSVSRHCLPPSPPLHTNSPLQKISTLASKLDSITRQQTLHSSVIAAADSLRKLGPAPSSDAALQDADAFIASSPFQSSTDTELVAVQNELLEAQRVLLAHYRALSQQVAEDYVFPLTSVLATMPDPDSLAAAKRSTDFDMESLLTSDSTSTFDGSDTLNLQHLINLDARSALAESESSRRQLQQSIAELEASIVEISAEKSEQHVAVTRDLEKAQSELATLQQQTSSSSRDLSTVEDSPDTTALLSQIERLQAEIQQQSSQHASEFETILMQNAQLNEKLNATAGLISSEEANALREELTNTKTELVNTQNRLREKEEEYTRDLASAGAMIAAASSNNEAASRRALLETELRQSLEQAETEVTRLLELNAQKDQQISRLRAATATSIPLAAADEAKQSLQQENTDLRSKVSKLESELASLSEEHAAEFQTILMQNAVLSERLAGLEASRAEKRTSASNIAQQGKNPTPLRPGSRVLTPGSGIDDEHSVAQLKAELRQVQAGYDSLLQQSLEFEGERISLEHELDAVRERNLELEAHIADSRVRVLAAHTDSSGGVASNIINTPGESASVAVLRKEFRKMVTEMKATHAQAMKAELEERRRLEKVIRDLRRMA
ncbi:hypothetical protein BZA70DRAFT_275761 [Myxozyma melibiosi]|uniref:DUF7801 domain-containing protein n=1 Tax=Myxozyma melibiosi TaxID=54550 RepID=A0ABR1F8F9_9ASCO